jgi:guanidinopropionase
VSSPMEDLRELGTLYQHWHGLPTFLNCPADLARREAEIGLVGAPIAAGNTIERGQYLGPRAVRTMSMGHRRANRAFRFDPFAACRIRDLGDAPVANGLEANVLHEDLMAFFAQIDRARIRPVTVGGDHSVSIAVLRAIAGAGSRVGAPVGLVHFDAHTDYCPSPATDHIIHAASFHQVVNDGSVDPGRMVQIGVRGPMAVLEQDEPALEAGVRVVEQVELDEVGPDAVAAEARRVVGDGPVYVSFDMDTLDPVYAPAVSDPEAEGMSVKDALSILRGLRGLDIIGADVVEFCPAHDTRGGPSGGGLTTYHATTIFYELVSLIADRLASTGASANTAVATAGAR